MEKLFGGIEAGGTKFVCMVGTSPDHIIDEIRFPTTRPGETLQAVVDFFTPYIRSGGLAAVGVGAFGPVDLNHDSPTFGFITTTPKPGWAQVNLRGTLSWVLGVPVVVDTDVNAAAVGEYLWIEENRKLDPLIYLTVGTGIGVGGIVHGKPLHGLMHPEGGHFFIPHDWEADPFSGICPYHGDCLEGLACGPAMTQRWQAAPETLPDDHPAWDIEARYLALAVCNLSYALSPQRIVVGGGVLQHAGLLDLIRKKAVDLLNGYLPSFRSPSFIESYLVLPHLGARAGVLGAIALGKQAFERAATSMTGEAALIQTA